MRSTTTAFRNDDVDTGVVVALRDVTPDVEMLERLRQADVSVAEFVAAGGVFRPLSANIRTLPASGSPSP